jgi:hypothetical protein
MTRHDFRTRLALAHRMLARGHDPAPADVADQMQAANGEVRRMADRLGMLLPILSPDRNWHQMMESTPSETVRAYLLAGVFGCTDVCPHLRRGGPQPAIVRLPLHRVDCSRCVQTLRRAPANEDDQCDLCGKPETLTFVPFAVRQGPALIAGDVCMTCADVLGILREAAA